MTPFTASLGRFWMAAGALLHYRGGWFQFGYRYALDSIPFAIPIMAKAIERRGLPPWGIALIVIGCVVNAGAVLFTYFR